MSNNKQTAVEWLIEEMILRLAVRIENTFDGNNLLNQAKEMHKEEIIDAFVECWKANMPDGYECKLSAEEYYNEKYGKDDADNTAV